MINLSNLVNKIKRKGVTIKIENRFNWNDYKFPYQHAEILKNINPADKDNWDALILGYDRDFKLDTQFVSNKILGIILVEDGNHKVLFKIPYFRGFKQKLYDKEVKKFMKIYEEKNNLKLKYLNANLLDKFLSI
jgi:hypothetical protein